MRTPLRVCGTASSSCVAATFSAPCRCSRARRPGTGDGDAKQRRAESRRCRDRDPEVAEQADFRRPVPRHTVWRVGARSAATARREGHCSPDEAPRVRRAPSRCPSGGACAAASPSHAGRPSRSGGHRSLACLPEDLCSCRSRSSSFVGTVSMCLQEGRSGGSFLEVRFGAVVRRRARAELIVRGHVGRKVPAAASVNTSGVPEDEVGARFRTSRSRSASSARCRSSSEVPIHPRYEVFGQERLVVDGWVVGLSAYQGSLPKDGSTIVRLYRFWRCEPHGLESVPVGVPSSGSTGRT